jgi:lipid-A-disaccharide synthase
VRLFIVAGESSGDQLGADLIGQLQLQTDVHITGIGGTALADAGLNSIYPMSDLSVMGWRDVYLRLPLLLLRLKQTVDAIVACKPDIVVLVDAQEFSNRVAAGVRKRLPNAKIVLYVAPSVWAWKPERAKQILPLYDQILSVLPFEPRVFRELGGPVCTYVGHMAERFYAGTTERVCKQFLLLPGSRNGEIKRNLSEMTMAIDWLKEAQSELKLTLAAAPGKLELISKLLDSPDISIGEGRQQFGQLVSNAKAAIAVSGTVTLELGFADVPHICMYVAEPKQLKNYEANGRPLINLNNIIVGRMFVPEIAGTHALAPEILSATQNLLNNDSEMALQREGFAQMRAKMQNGEPEAPRQNAADIILSMV